MNRIVTLLLLATALISGCSEAEPSGEILPFTDIAAAGPAIDLDPSGVSAVLTVETTIDAICAVAYGTDGPEGQIATDRDMQSGGHSEHRVILDGLMPDTEYSYRLQGVAVDGALYRSDTLTFRTPPGGGAAAQRNLALGASVVDVSSEHSATFAASNAVDGDLATEWSSRGDGSEAFIIIDLGAQAHIEAVAFRTRQMSDGSAVATTFTLAVDGESAQGPYPAGPDPVEIDLTGRTIRFDVAESTGGNTGALEIEVYGESGG